MFAIVSEVKMIGILQETKSTHTSECSVGSPDDCGIQRKQVCDANSSTSFIYGHILPAVYFLIKYVVNFLLVTVLATVNVFCNLNKCF
jgi:hypothetical protein